MRTTHGVPEKRRIAAAAVALLGDAETIFIDEGFTPQLTTSDLAVADVRAPAVRAARRCIFVGIHTKFGVRTFCRFAEVSDFESLITDTALPASEAQRCSRLGPQVIRV
jgi:DeoR/GlpR family transcriptional regulator of sugar metabolism